MKKILTIAIAMILALGIHAANRVDFKFIIPHSEAVTFYDGYALLTDNGSESNFRMIFETPNGTKAVLVGPGDKYFYEENVRYDEDTEMTDGYIFYQPGGAKCLVQNILAYGYVDYIEVGRLNADGSMPFVFRIYDRGDDIQDILNLINRAISKCRLQRQYQR